MATDRFEIRVSLEKLFLGLMITIVPLCLLSLYAFSRTEQSMEEAVGANFKTIASLTAAEVATFVNDRVLSVATLAADPGLAEAVEGANRGYAGATPEAVAARLEAVEKEWNTPKAEGRVREMLGSKASLRLNRWRDLDRRFLRITLTDAYGGVVAATHKTLDYNQADEEFWQAVSANGRGGVHLTDILYDEVTKSNYIGIGVPVMAAGSNQFIGVLDALVEVSTIFPTLRRADLGRNARTMLVKSDGTIIDSPDTNLAMRVKSPEHAAMIDAAGKRRNGFVLTNVQGTPIVIGFASTGLEEHFPDLDWTVLIAQDRTAALAPVAIVQRLIALLALTGLVMVTLLAAWLSVHRKREYVDIAERQER
jgi:hypothetical protein